MNTENNEDKKIQDAYLEYYYERLRNAYIITIYLYIIPLFCYIPILLVPIMPEQLQYTHIIVLLISGVISVAISLYGIKTHFNNLYSKIKLVYPVISFPLLVLYILVLVLFSGIHSYFALFLITFFHGIFTLLPMVLGFICFILEFFSLRSAIKIMPEINSPKEENHTAIIIPHDAKKTVDVSDLPVPTLINVLKNYNENFGVYFCLYEKDMVSVLTKPNIDNIKRIWIFGHGTRGSCGLTDKVFKYADFMEEKNEKGEKLHNIQPMEYVYQCHCNPESTKPLTEYLLKEKGRLNQSVDNMPNFNDRGIADMEIELSIKNIPLLTWSCINKIHGKVCNKDYNYMNIFSVRYLIKRYETHLKRKRKANKQQKNNA